ncbi:MAG: DUF4838 domain-containing protein [Victivallales bacterium]
MNMKLNRCMVGLLLVGAMLLNTGFAVAAPVSAHLADNGSAKMSIVIGKTADDAVKAHAKPLAEYLKKISGAKFEIVEGDGKSGIAVGTFKDFPELKLDSLFKPDDPLRREEYLLRSHKDGILLVGVNAFAVRHAVWDLLHRFGYRQYIPSANWEIIPENKVLDIAVDDFEKPDFLMRDIWYSGGLFPNQGKLHAEWVVKNRLNMSSVVEGKGGFNARSGHSWEGVIQNNKKALEEHPEYFALIKGERTKRPIFCVTNPGFQKLFVEDRMAALEKGKSNFISVEKSDAGGLCECEECKKLGNNTDQMVTLANLVAEAIDKKGLNKYVGMLAYADHALPPTIKVNPRVFASVCTAWNPQPVDKLLEGWGKQGASLGVYDYYTLAQWYGDTPGSTQFLSLESVSRNIPTYHERGAKIFAAESSPNFVACGLPFYLTTRLLWDVKEGGKADEIREEFYENCFGKSKQQVRVFYELFDAKRASAASRMGPLLTIKMYGILKDAMEVADSPAVKRRIEDLVLYTRYCELRMDYTTKSVKSEEEKQKAAEALIRYSYRISDRMLVHSLWVWIEFQKYIKTLPENCGAHVPADKNPWKKESAPFTEAEISSYINSGVEDKAFYDDCFVDYGNELVPSGAPSAQLGVWSGMAGSRRLPRLLFHGDKTTVLPPITLQSEQGVPLVWSLKDLSGKILEQGRLSATGKPQDIVFKTSGEGLFCFEAETENGSLNTVRVGLPKDAKVSIRADADRPAFFQSNSAMYFYVPKGMKKVLLTACFKDAGRIYDAKGKLVYEANGPVEAVSGRRLDASAMLNIPVGEGKDGQFWKIENFFWTTYLWNVPPYLALSPDRCVVPAKFAGEIREFYTGKTGMVR